MPLVTNESPDTEQELHLLTRLNDELHNPVSGVLGMTGLLLQSPLTPDQRQYAEAAHLSATTMLQIITNLLYFPKLEADMLANAPTTFDPRKTVWKVLELLAPEADAKGLTLALRCSPQVPSELGGDAWRIRQVLLNLIGNAIRFTRVGYVSIEVDCQELRPGLSQLQVRVSHSGSGIAASELGMEIARQLVEQMRGKFTVESRESEGATLSFSLPLPLPVCFGSAAA